MAVADTQTALLHCKNRHKNRCVNLYIIFTAKYVRETNVINGETTCTKKPIFSHLCFLKNCKFYMHRQLQTNKLPAAYFWDQPGAVCTVTTDILYMAYLYPHNPCRYMDYGSGDD